MATGQWWVILTSGSWWNKFVDPLIGNETGMAQVAATATVVQSATKPASYYKGPYATQAQAEQIAGEFNSPSAVSEAGETINKGPASGSGQPLNWSLVANGISGWFMRGLKVLFGGILMIVGISHLAGVDNKITALAGKVPVLA